jgi:hypothetical protein
MERFQWFFEEILAQFKAAEASLSALLSKIPGIGQFAGDHSNIVLMAIMALITVAIIKPLVKWSFMIVSGGTVLAVIISYFSGLAFWGILPLTALGVSIVLFSNKFTME